MSVRCSSRRIQWLRALAKRHADLPRLAVLTAVLNDIENLQEDRNFVTHGTWFQLEPTNIAAAASVRLNAPPNEVVIETFPPARMRDIAQRIYEAQYALIAWRDELEASRQISSPPPPAD